MFVPSVTLAFLLVIMSLLLISSLSVSSYSMFTRKQVITHHRLQGVVKQNIGVNNDLVIQGDHKSQFFIDVKGNVVVNKSIKTNNVTLENSISIDNNILTGTDISTINNIMENVSISPQKYLKFKIPSNSKNLTKMIDSKEYLKDEFHVSGSNESLYEFQYDSSNLTTSLFKLYPGIYSIYLNTIGTADIGMISDDIRIRVDMVAYDDSLTAWTDSDKLWTHTGLIQSKTIKLNKKFDKGPIMNVVTNLPIVPDTTYTRLGVQFTILYPRQNMISENKDWTFHLDWTVQRMT